MVDMVTYSKGNNKLCVFNNKVIVKILDLGLEFWDVMMTN